MVATKMVLSQELEIAAGLLLLIWSLDLFLFIVFLFTLGSLYFPIAVLVVLMLIILVSNIQPHKSAVGHYATIDITFYCLLALYFTAVEAASIASIKARFFYQVCYIASAIIACFPLLYISCLSIHWIFARRKWGKKLISRVKAWHNGYDYLTDDFPDRILNPGKYERLQETASREAAINNGCNN